VGSQATNRRDMLPPVADVFTAIRNTRMKTSLSVAAFFAVLLFLLTAPVRAQGVDAEKGIKEAATKLQPGTY